MFRLFAVTFSSFLALISEPLAAGSLIEPKSGAVEIYQEASNKSAVLGKLAENESIESSDRVGMYWKVKYQNKDAFVAVMAVKRKSVEGDDKLASALKKEVQEKKEDEAVGIRARSAVMGVRGLDESSDIDYIGNVKPNLRAVYSMEGFSVSKNDLTNVETAIFSEIQNKAAQ